MKSVVALSSANDAHQSSEAVSTKRLYIPDERNAEKGEGGAGREHQLTNSKVAFISSQATSGKRTHEKCDNPRGKWDHAGKSVPIAGEGGRVVAGQQR
jgi:hypothetical protein